jgi:diguanylate cyclase (GGDEF)-like protein
VVVVTAIWALTTAVLVARTPVRLEQGLIFLLMIATGLCAIETTRLLGEPAGVMATDMSAVSMVPVALVLPPVYALLSPVALIAYTHFRVRRTTVYRRVFTVAALGLGYVLASAFFHHQVAAGHLQRLSPGAASLRWALLALAVAVLQYVIHTVLVAFAVKASSPGESWMSVLFQAGDRMNDVGELFSAVMIGLLCLLNPLLCLLSLVPVFLLQRAQLHDQLAAAARLDPKTGLLNAPTWEREATAEIARAHRTHGPLSVMLLDLDHFKQINDQYGHLAGDDVITSVADVISHQVREYDQCARFGGDEFAVLLPQADVTEAVRTAERIRRHVAGIRVLAGTDVVRTSVSIGVAELTAPEQGVTDLLAAADVSLYRAKEGRDQVHSARHDLDLNFDLDFD